MQERKTEQKAPIDRLPADVRAIVDSLMKVLALYIPGTEKIEMLVGWNVTATLTFRGGPLTREVIEDTMAHLAFYKKYFPKDAAEDHRLDSSEKILDALAAQWEAHRAALPAEVQH